MSSKATSPAPPDSHGRLAVWSPAVVCGITGLHRTTLYRMARSGTFPAPRQLSPGRIGWLSTEVEAWLRARPVAISARATTAESR
jgi:prophage regulatory protein